MEQEHLLRDWLHFQVWSSYQRLAMATGNLLLRLFGSFALRVIRVTPTGCVSRLNCRALSTTLTINFEERGGQLQISSEANSKLLVWKQSVEPQNDEKKSQRKYRKSTSCWLDGGTNQWQKQSSTTTSKWKTGKCLLVLLQVLKS